MKKTISYIICLLLCVANVCLLYHCFQLKRIATKETSYRQHAELAVLCGIRNAGHSVSLDSIASGHHLILRYASTACLTCIAKAEELLDDVFGKEFLTKELCCIGGYGQVKPNKDFSYIQSDARMTPADDIYTPYICVVNDDGDILFTLSLIPDMYDYNRKILTRLKRSLKCDQKESE